MNVKNKIILLSLIIIISLTPLAFSQEPLEVSLSEEVYFQDDIIVISGQVSSVIENTSVTIHIILLGAYNEESIIEIAQIEVAQDGTFSKTIHATGKQWQTEGEYVVRAFYGVNSVADVYFDFFRKDLVASAIFEVEKPDQSGTFDIEYIIRGGNLIDIIVNQEFFELIVLIEPKSDGVITLELPRTAIDAKKSDGTDDIFIILIDGIEVPFTETQNDANTRTIIIEFEKTDSNIEIIGTNILKPLPIITSSGLSNIGVLADSKFRLIPDKPNVGSMIRVTGSNFAENVKLELFIENSKLETFSTNEDGFFVITTQIPEGKADRVNFIVKDSQGNEKTISIRLGGEEKRVSSDVPFTVETITPQKTIEQIPEPDEKKLPDWVRNIFIWYAEGQIGEDDLINALEFLINEGIINYLKVFSVNDIGFGAHSPHFVCILPSFPRIDFIF